MQVKSWKAALVLAASLTAAAPFVAGADNPAAAQDRTNVSETGVKTEPRDGSSKGASSSGQPVELNLMIAGLGRDGCDVEVKPGTRSCKFQPQTQHVGSQGKANLVFRDIEFRGADRNCSFAITVRETGQAPRTIYRGFRMPHRVDSARATAPQAFTCFMTSPSKLAGLVRSDRTRQ